MKRDSIFTKIFIFFVFFIILLMTIYLFVASGFYFKKGGDFMRRVHQNIETIKEVTQTTDSIVLENLELEIIPVEEAYSILRILPIKELPPPPPFPNSRKI